VKGPFWRLPAGGVVAIASALAAAFLVWFAYTRGFSPEFWVALSGALVGGVLAMVGNYLGSRALIDRERRREDRDLVGAIQVARSEISFDAAVLADLVERKFENFVGARLHDADFRQVNVALARGLPVELFADVSTTMNAVRRTTDKLLRDQVAGSGGIRGDTVKDCRDLLPHLNRINKRLLDHMRTVMKFRLPPPTAPNPFEGQGS
jgi:hypothetical protein